MKALDRCLAYLEKLPSAVSGSGGHDATLRAACEIIRFGLSPAEEWQAVEWYNANRCSPVWSEKELRHKLADAHKKAVHGERVSARQPVRPVSPMQNRVKPRTAAELAALSARHKATLPTPQPPNRQVTDIATTPAAPGISAPSATSAPVSATLESVAQAHLSALPDLPPLAERNWERVTALYAPEVVPTLPSIIRTALTPDGRILATWARPKGEAAKWPKPAPRPAATNTQTVSAQVADTDDGEYWQFVLAASREAEALAFANTD
jgi:hypothetical protein